MRALAAALAALSLAGCYYSEKALFDENGAVVPFTDGALFELRSTEKDEPPRVVRFARVGNGYELRSTAEDKHPIRMIFASVTQTRDDDYIAQVDLSPEADDGFVYWFLWPGGDDQYLILRDAQRVDEGGKPTFDRCAEALAGCGFDSAEDLRRHYMDVLYPVFSSGRRPASYVDMVPLEPTDATGQ